MGWAQILFGSVLIAALVAVAVGFLYYQVRALRMLADDFEWTDDERGFQRRQAYRRIAAAVLMLLIAALLLVVHVCYEDAAQQLADWLAAQPVRPEFTPEQTTFARVWGWLWLVILVLLLALVIVGAWDYLANRRHGLRQRRAIVAARREMIAEEVERLREK